MKKLILGIFIGFTLSIGVTAFAAEPVKEFILTKITYPFLVNGNEYKDEQLPILNYKGSTYIPLAKMGDLTGVDYKWNEELKRVEVKTAGGLPTGPNVSLPPGTKIESEPKASGLVDVNGQIVFQAYDKDGKFLGEYTNEYDGQLMDAKLEKRNELPPLLSEGWIGAGLLGRVFGYDLRPENDDYVIYEQSSSSFEQHGKEVHRFPLSKDFIDENINEIESSGVKIKQYYGGYYFYIDDLKNANIIN